jgi:protein-tyrosine phosphatase
MIPLVDVHVHLLAGMDDGPRTLDEALAMCRQAHGEGVRMMAATAHQNEQWCAVTPAGIRRATEELRGALVEAGIAISVFPNAEVTAQPETSTAYRQGELLSMADRQEYLLLEMPRRVFVDLRPTISNLRAAGVRPVLAHPEREAELLHESGRIDELIEAGCLVQVSAGSVTNPPRREDGRALKRWLQRGIVHLVGSDGHSPQHRPPHMAAAYHRIAAWAGAAVADRVCSTHGMAILHGLPLQVLPPEPERRLGWLPRLW